MLSGGVFYKSLHDYIFPFVVNEEVSGDLFRITEPRNGEGASLFGMELAFQNKLHFLPGFLNGLGVSELHLHAFVDQPAGSDRGIDAAGAVPPRGQPGCLVREGRVLLQDRMELPRQIRRYLGETEADDVYYDDHVQVDINASQRLTKNIRVYADFLNLTNAPLRYFEGTWDRPIQEDYTAGG